MLSPAQLAKLAAETEAYHRRPGFNYGFSLIESLCSPSTIFKGTDQLQGVVTPFVIPWPSTFVRSREDTCEVKIGSKTRQLTYCDYLFEACTPTIDASELAEASKLDLCI
jgi:hypothetical protein